MTQRQVSIEYKRLIKLHKMPPYFEEWSDSDDSDDSDVDEIDEWVVEHIKLNRHLPWYRKREIIQDYIQKLQSQQTTKEEIEKNDKLIKILQNQQLKIDLYLESQDDFMDYKTKRKIDYYTKLSSMHTRNFIPSRDDNFYVVGV